MDMKSIETFAGIVSGLAWPIVLIVIVVLYRKQIKRLVTRITHLRAGNVTIALNRLTEKVDHIESATCNLTVDLYKVTGDALRVREEIWKNLAGVLDNASPSTKFEIRKVLPEHIPKVELKVSQAKNILSHLKFLECKREEHKQFGEDITSEFNKAIYDF